MNEHCPNCKPAGFGNAGPTLCDEHDVVMVKRDPDADINALLHEVAEDFVTGHHESLTPEVEEERRRCLRYILRYARSYHPGHEAVRHALCFLVDDLRRGDHTRRPR